METLEVKTDNHDQLIDITDQVRSAISRMQFDDGVLVVYVPHTTAGILINEAADPSVAHDVQEDLKRLVPWEQSYYRHREGNSSSHARASLVGSSELVIVENGKPQLGTWQGIFFIEFDGPRRRKVYLKALPV